MFKFTRILISIIYPLLVLGIMIFCLLTCGGGEKPAAGRQEAPEAVRRFVPPVIPVELTRPAERA
ncbi:hypothetical protein ACFO6W_22765, partial [Dysgonomonas termitidis]